MRYWILFSFLFVYGLVISQSKPLKVDSLLDRLKVVSGMERAEVLAGLSRLAVPKNLDSAVNMIAEATSIYKSQQNDTAVFVLYLNFAKALRQKGKSELALQYAYKARRIENEQVKTNHFKLLFNNELAEIYFRFKGNYDSALYYNKEALALASDSLNQGLVLNRMGLCYNSLGMTVKALESYILALPLLEKKAKLSIVASIYNNMGILYEDDGNNSKAESYYKKASTLYKQSGNVQGEYNLLNNIGILYDHQQRYEESLTILSEAAKLLPSLPSEIETAILDLNVGNTLTHMGRAIEAIGRFEKAMQIFIKIDDRYGITLCHRQLGEAMYKIARYKDAETEELIALELAKKYGYTSLYVDAFHDLGDIYGASRQFEKAYRFKSKYHRMNDSISSRDRASKLGLLDKEYEIAQRESEQQRLERENELHAAQARIDKVTRVGLASGLGLFAIASVTAFLAYNRTKSKNQLLAKQKKEIEAANTVIVKQSEELQEAARTKSRFFANVSHELRTPVTLITGMLELMEKETHRSIPKMSVALNNSRRLQTLVDEVLDLSRLEADKIQIKKSPKEIAPLLHRIVFSFDSLFESKKISVAYDDAQLKEVLLAIDEDKFEKIINNILYNAVKFNYEGGSIKVIGKLDDQEERVIIQIGDSGIGIPENDIPHIFDRFYQSNFSKKKNSGGIGIGLSLVKEYTELHGGKVTVISKENEGATFELQFPVAKIFSPEEIEMDRIEEDELPVSFSDLETTPTILVVEDSKEMQFYLNEIFGENVKLVPTDNGKEALQWLSQNTPDLIISDVMMPEMDGYELMRHLKSSDKLRNIPVVLLTARGSEEDLLAGLMLGVDDYIIKPFHVKELKIRIHNLLLNQQIRRDWQLKSVDMGEEIEVKSTTTENAEFIETVERYVKDHLKDALLGIADLADHLAVSERQLYRKCGLLTGMTPAHLIKEIRLKAAYKMLIDKEVNKISDLAMRVGFDNSAYFSRQFLGRFGRKPVEML
jgi:signal transduction histidine kinase/DNA-binding NarL/FixJ family response regulator/Flp pilus assembly protein TadD